MWVKFLCLASLAGVVFGGSVPFYSGPDKGQGVESVEGSTTSSYYELPCMSYGGLCLQKNECPAGKEAGVKGLCPQRQHQGVECCFSAPKSTICRLKGGECMSKKSSKCPGFLTVLETSDCQPDETCCILVK